ncbi:MAG: UDP-N-acetylglucosamine 2-epimerase [Chloroflexi bacterium]|nr:UDP-N-acetylglucosamine 2-epimerase [Chloroflexota bacterium]
MARQLMSAQAMVTDSGGAQKGPFFYGVPAFILRTETEWTEVTKAGWNRLAPPGHADTMATTMLAIDTLPKRPIAPYGVGTASVKVALDLLRRYAG